MSDSDTGSSVASHGRTQANKPAATTSTAIAAPAAANVHVLDDFFALLVTRSVGSGAITTRKIRAGRAMFFLVIPESHPAMRRR